MVKAFPNLMKTINPGISQNTIRNKKKTIPRDIVIEFLK